MADLFNIEFGNLHPYNTDSMMWTVKLFLPAIHVSRNYITSGQKTIQLTPNSMEFLTPEQKKLLCSIPRKFCSGSKHIYENIVRNALKMLSSERDNISVLLTIDETGILHLSIYGEYRTVVDLARDLGRDNWETTKISRDRILD